MRGEHERGRREDLLHRIGREVSALLLLCESERAGAGGAAALRAGLPLLLPHCSLASVPHSSPCLHSSCSDGVTWTDRLLSRAAGQRTAEGEQRKAGQSVTGSDLAAKAQKKLTQPSNTRNNGSETAMQVNDKT